MRQWVHLAEVDVGQRPGASEYSTDYSAERAGSRQSAVRARVFPVR